MIEGITARLLTSKEPHDTSLTQLALTDDSGLLALSVFLVVGPPDPNALSYLLPRSVFERGAPVHVGALSQDDDLIERLLEILEVMDTGDVAVFLCDTAETLSATLEALAVDPNAHDPAA
jgi:hypothetical protein